MTKISELKQKWLEGDAVKASYIEQEPEFELARKLVKARVDAGLTQDEVADLMDTTQSVIARMESGRALPSVKSLIRYGKAVGRQLDIRFC